MTAPRSAEGHQDVGLEYTKHEKLGKLGFFSMQRGLRGELTTDFNNYGGDGAVFSQYAQQKDKKLQHKLEEGKFQSDIRKKIITMRVASTGTGCPESTRKGPKQPH